MSTLSLAQQRQLEQKQAERQEKIQATIVDLTQEIQGISDTSGWFREVLEPKYRSDFSDEEWTQIKSSVVENIFPTEEPKVQLSQEAIRIAEQQAGQPLVAKYKDVQSPAPAYKDGMYPWDTLKAIKSFFTNTLEVKLLQKNSTSPTVQLRRKNETEGYVTTVSETLSAEQTQTLAKYVGGEQYVPVLLSFITKNF
jgi:hypothetical protein